MKRKLLSLTLSAATLSIACLIGSPAWSADRHDPVQRNQQQRITQGVRSGEITRPELRKLRHEQRRIKRFSRQARADGKMNKWERRHLKAMKNHASRNIYQAKHNKRSYNHCHPQNTRHRKNCHAAAGHKTCRKVDSVRIAMTQPGMSFAWNMNLH
ncbi:hypothetical protein Pcar_1543 [Syntrophotalea carbinolica DSM 2380]|uniref:Uncharacterized protein n=1 Tax=Syntrophotalea carbinolica (strain DSM 2380 / NBRC 103641 / GraBd1) TaxID=338963 RepID=Q3A4B9_SYNC1|nr:hypothetical protein [Syntrophotalea carbinolica]ABA88788.1 hypothetical protein Pcar_1543 [Syntrophotalea carbinolica DSM 2380]